MRSRLQKGKKTNEKKTKIDKEEFFGGNFLPHEK